MLPENDESPTRSILCIGANGKVIGNSTRIINMTASAGICFWLCDRGFGI
jgi:hypothetical protein